MNIHKLNLKRDQRELAKFKLYKKVLNRIYRKIEQTSNSYQITAQWSHLAACRL